MAIPSTVSYSVTRNELIEEAFSIIGISELSNEDYAKGVKRLNALVRSIDNKSTHLWTLSNSESSLTTVSDQQTYSTGVGATNISASILKLEYAAVLINSDYKELTIYDKFSAFRSVFKSDSNAEPEACYLDRKNALSSNLFYLYPTPNAAYTIKYNFRRPLYDFSLSTDNPDFPLEFSLALEKLLAHELSYDYSKPLSERQLLKAEGESAWREAVSANSDKPSYQTMKATFF